MLTAYKLLVGVFCGRERPYVRKDIVEQEVHTITEKYVTFLEGGDKVRVPRSQVYLSREEAEREAESRANDAISSLMLLVNELKKPAEHSKSVWLERKEMEQER